ncbi:uncharacterized protein MELLADRAFT_76833 [Melampsora larici-populina 98AG31]|uniref:Tethering factor for nuclear proteasome STS1 n=1 Tax=Melampsora larici-populina (strain 98AG31 / pathotype 3-4-7) TaxID=747676 RepID=F4RAE2_MELLP|nr:uncharacterized protein MELLADRAFT_76833 [Melampsora larici-populina 98AG31]EGG10797.1 hypothetical protein MELLADRAFT_76833 [Melampsora larici-populina 98AG31]
MTTTHSPLLPMSHQVPFRQPALPVPLSWGFARPSQSFLQPTSLSPKKEQPRAVSSSKTRKRCTSEEMDHDQQPISTRIISACPIKRVKKGVSQSSSDADMTTSDSKDDGEDQIDLGKAFSSLTKPELLTLLQSIVAQHPELKRSIPALLPKPTIEAITTKLAEVESQLLESIPNKRTNREEYIWNRVRCPLNEYVNECLGLLKIWTKGEDGFEQSQIHTTVSNQFSFLYLLTTSIKKIDNCLPTTSRDQSDMLNYAASQPLRSVLIPDLLQAWRQFIEKIYHITSTNGIILSESSIEKWFAQLNDLAHPTSEDDRSHSSQFMEPIRDLAKRQFGDIVRSRRTFAPFNMTVENAYSQQTSWTASQGFSSRLMTGGGHYSYGQSHEEML